jgi:hypothetical protein
MGDQPVARIRTHDRSFRAAKTHALNRTTTVICINLIARLPIFNTYIFLQILDINDSFPFTNVFLQKYFGKY